MALVSCCKSPHVFCSTPVTGLVCGCPDRDTTGWAWFSCPATGSSGIIVNDALKTSCAGQGQEVIGWRSVPTDNLYLGETAKSREPFIRQVFIKRSA